MEVAIPATLIKQAIAKTKVKEERYRWLPANLVIFLTIASCIHITLFNVSTMGAGMSSSTK